MSADRVYKDWQATGFNNRWVFRLAHWVCRLFPRPLLYTLSDSVMDWFQGANTAVACAVADNLAKAFPDRPQAEVEAHAGRTFQNYGRGVVDYLTADGQGSEVVPWEGALATMASLRGGAILVTAHMGNWEVGGDFLGRAVGPHTMVGFPERDAGVETFRQSKRGASGHTTLSVGMGLEGMLRLRRGLESGERMVVLVDRAVGKDCVEVVFRGRPSNFLRSPAVFSHLTGVPLVPVAVMCDGSGRYSAWVGTPFRTADCDGPEAAMQKVADFFSEVLERYPDQWYNFFRYWREGP